MATPSPVGRVLAAIVVMSMAAQAWALQGGTPTTSGVRSSGPETAAAPPRLRNCKPATEFTPEHCALRLPKIASVVITQNGARSSLDAQPEARCDAFRLSVRQATAFLRSARQVSPGEAQHDMDWSPCFASGHVTFVDGSRAEWVIDMFGGGALTKDAAAAPLPLYCPTCTHKPFVR